MDFPEMDVAVTLTGREWYCVMKTFIRQDDDEVLKNIALVAMAKIADQVREVSEAAFAAKCREEK
jgi:hypothetical protein